MGKPKSHGILYETGDRWKLDVLIPNRDRLLVGPQIPRTDHVKVATKAIVITACIDPTLRKHEPIYTGPLSTIEEQRLLRARHGGDIALPGDRIE